MSDDKAFQEITEFKTVTESDLCLDQIIPNIEDILFAMQQSTTDNESMNSEDKMTSFYNANAQTNVIISQRVEALRNSLQRVRECVNNNLAGDGCDVDTDTQRKLMLARGKILTMKDNLLRSLYNDLDHMDS